MLATQSCDLRRALCRKRPRPCRNRPAIRGTCVRSPVCYPVPNKQGPRERPGGDRHDVVARLELDRGCRQMGGHLLLDRIRISGHAGGVRNPVQGLQLAQGHLARHAGRIDLGCPGRTNQADRPRSRRGTDARRRNHRRENPRGRGPEDSTRVAPSAAISTAVPSRSFNRNINVRSNRNLRSNRSRKHNLNHKHSRHRRPATQNRVPAHPSRLPVSRNDPPVA